MTEETIESVESTAEGEPVEVQGDVQSIESTWNYADGIAGQGDPPDWLKTDKYATVADQAKAYKELETRFGSFSGAPEKYEISLSDELVSQGIEINHDDPIMEEAINFAKKANMSQEGFNSMVNLYAMSKLAESKAVEEKRTEEIKALGVNAQTRLDGIAKWGKANLSEDLYDGLVDAASSASAVQAIEKIISMTRNAPISPNETKAVPGGITEEELKKMQFEKDENGNRRMQTDPAFRKKWEKLAEQVYGTEDHRIIIG